MKHGQGLPGSSWPIRSTGHRGSFWEEDSQWICLEASLCAVVQLGGWSPQLTGGLSVYRKVLLAGVCQNTRMFKAMSFN